MQLCDRVRLPPSDRRLPGRRLCYRQRVYHDQPDHLDHLDHPHNDNVNHDLDEYVNVDNVYNVHHAYDFYVDKHDEHDHDGRSLCRGDLQHPGV
jgi:hypothetical protein